MKVHPPCSPLTCLEVPRLTQESSVLAPIQAPPAVLPPLNEALADELPPNNIMSSVTLSEPPGFESVSLPVSNSVPLPVSSFVNGCRTSKPCSMLETSQEFDADIIGDDLDDLLDQAGPESAMVSERMGPRGSRCVGV